jgi:hypothetical protein
MCTNPWRAAAGSAAVVLALAIGGGVAEAGAGALLGVTPLVAAGLQARGQEVVASRAVDVPAPANPHARRPQILIPLYCVFAGLQIADAHSTYSAGQRGIGESNPLMMGVAGSPAGLATAKVAATATTIVATELLWRRNRKAAVITTIGLNVAYAAIVAHNYRAASSR